MEWYLGRIYGAAVSTLGLRIEVHEPELTANEQAARLARPVIVLSRHAGPATPAARAPSATVYHRRPRIVMKAALQLDPGWTWSQPGAQRVHLPQRVARRSTPSRSGGWPRASATTAHS